MDERLNEINRELKELNEALEKVPDGLVYVEVFLNLLQVFCFS